MPLMPFGKVIVVMAPPAVVRRVRVLELSRVPVDRIHGGAYGRRMASLADDGLAEFVSRPGPSIGEIEVEALRAQSAERARGRAPGPALDTVADLDVAGRPARLYRPAPGPLPLVLYLHGGGWTVGSLDTFDRVCRRLAAGSATAVLALDYRLAPEHPWPASVDDTVDALE